MKRLEQPAINLNDEKVQKIRRNMLHLFDQSVGFEVRIKGSPLVTVVEGVDWEFQHVCTPYGNFHVDYCELTGKKFETPES